MGRFADFAKGTRARKEIVLPLPGAQLDPDTLKWVGDTVPLDIRVLRDDEYADVLKNALAFAKDRGVESPEDGDTLYERGKMVHTLAVACIDHDSIVEKPVLFFDDWKQIHTSEILTPEVINYLYLQQQLWQEEVAPLIRKLTTEQFLAAAVKTAGGDMSFFVGSRPGILWSFTRTLASLHVSSLAQRSPGTTSSEPPTTTQS